MKSSLRYYGLCKIFVLIGAALMMSGCFFSCSKKVSVTAITSTLDEVDRYINQGQTEVALKLLDKTDNKYLSSQIRLGICRRYLKLGEIKKAEKLLVSALKNDSENLQVIAVYTSVLLKKGDVDSAINVGKKLSGSDYASIYAEAVLKSKIQDKENSVEEVFFTDDYSPIYMDAYLGSKDNRWLRNCAIVSLLKGNGAHAFAFCPLKYEDAKDAYFWALIKYDCKKFVDAADCFKIVINFADKNDGVIKSKQDYDFSLKARALLADCFVNLSEDSLAEKERTSILEYFTTLDENSNSQINSDFYAQNSSGDILNVIYLNSAIWAQTRGDVRSSYNLLSFVVEKWPDFAPGLIAYGNFAYNSNLAKPDDLLTQELRKLGIQSMDMKTFDSLPKIPVADAIARMEDSLKRFNNSKLYFAKLDLEDKNSPLSDKAFLAKLYFTLESNALDTNLYSPEIVRYVMHGLLTLDRKEEAKELFTKYICARYDFDKTKNFYDEFFHNIHQIENWEVESAAWFAADEKKGTLAKQLYEFAVFDEYIKDSKTVREFSTSASVSAKMNLAMIYSSTKNKIDAISLYGTTANEAQDFKTKSEALYRLGVLYNEQLNMEDAEKALKYAIYLNPEHSKARLLLSKLKL